MKRLLILFLSAVISLCSLGGCSVKKNISSYSQEYLISAMGFDQINGKLTAYLEAVIVNTEDTNAERRLELIEGNGATVKEALSNANKKTAQPLLLSHCGVVVIGNSVSPQYFSGICDYFYRENELTLSVFFVSAENASSLLSSEAISSIAVGYDIMSMLSQQSQRTGISYKNRFYQIYSAKAKPLNTVAIPYFKTTDKGYYIDGLTIFEGFAPVMRLDNTQTALYAILTDTQGSGSVLIDGKELKISSSYARWKFEKDQQLKIRLLLDLKTEKSTEVQPETVKQEIEELFAASRQAGTDFFALGNILYSMKKDVWDQIQKDYVNQYKNSVLTVELQ